MGFVQYKSAKEFDSIYIANKLSDNIFRDTEEKTNEDVCFKYSSKDYTCHFRSDYYYECIDTLSSVFVDVCADSFVFYTDDLNIIKFIEEYVERNKQVFEPFL